MMLYNNSYNKKAIQTQIQAVPQVKRKIPMIIQKISTQKETNQKILNQKNLIQYRKIQKN